jgi:hypothetical protein
MKAHLPPDESPMRKLIVIGKIIIPDEEAKFVIEKIIIPDEEAQSIPNATTRTPSPGEMRAKSRFVQPAPPSGKNLAMGFTRL